MARIKKFILLFLSLFNFIFIAAMDYNCVNLEHANNDPVGGLQSQIPHNNICIICKENTPTTAIFSCGHAAHPTCIFLQNNYFENYFENCTITCNFCNSFFYCPECLALLNFEEFPTIFLNEIKSYAEAEFRYAVMLLLHTEATKPLVFFENVPKAVITYIKAKIDYDYLAYQEITLQRKNEYFASNYSNWICK